MTTKSTINFDKFLEIQEQLDIRIGCVINAVHIPKKDKLIQLTVSFGLEDDIRTVVTNLGEFFEPVTFIGRKFPFIVNLEPVKLGGVVSEAMIMIGKNDNDAIELGTITDFTCGSKIL